VRIYESGSLSRTLYFRTLPKFGTLNYVRDFALTLTMPIALRRKFDYFIGSNPLNALAGILLRRLGFVQDVVFYKIDYVPKRFANRVLNTLYNRLDRFSSEHSDWTWNLAQTMIKERSKRGLRLSHQLVVPIGTNFERIRRAPPSQVIPSRLVYMGSLRQGQGIQLAVEAFSEIKRELSQAELVIVGNGPLEKELKSNVTKLGLDYCVTFTGQIPSHEEVERILTTCGIGLAPYEPSTDNYTQYTEPGKVKVYLACGLPVVITRVPEIARDIEQSGAGVVIDYNAHDLAVAIETLIRDESTYWKARSAAISFASRYTWDSIFETAFSSMLNGSS